MPQLFCKSGPLTGIFMARTLRNHSESALSRSGKVDCFIFFRLSLYNPPSKALTMSSFFFIMVEIVDCDKGGSKRLATTVCFSPFLIALTNLYFSSKVRTRLFYVSCFLDFVDCDVEAVELETAPLSRAGLSRLAIGTLVTALSDKNRIQQGW